MDDDFGDDADYSAAFAAVEAASKPGPSATLAAPPTKASSSGVQQPKPQTLANRATVSAILVSSRQKGNPILKHVVAFPWEFADIPADYVVGNTTCALFLSLKYHRLHPEYIYSRIRALGGKYNLRILLTMVDVQNHEESLKELAKTSMVNNLTLMLCWTAQEAGHYLDLYKSLENIQPGTMRHQHTKTYKESLEEFVTVPRSINKSDARGLISQFGSLREAVNAYPEHISTIPGWGDRKVQQWCNAVREPFRVPKAARSGADQLRTEPARGSTAGLGVVVPTKQPLPINTTSSKPSLNGNSSTTSESKSRKRLAQDLEEDEDEDAIIAAAEAESNARAKQPRVAISPPQPPPEEDNLPEGVSAALARLREKG